MMRMTGFEPAASIVFRVEASVLTAAIIRAGFALGHTQPPSHHPKHRTKQKTFDRESCQIEVSLFPSELPVKRFVGRLGHQHLLMKQLKQTGKTPQANDCG
jgi:hypothetical protein